MICCRVRDCMVVLCLNFLAGAVHVIKYNSSLHSNSNLLTADLCMLIYYVTACYNVLVYFADMRACQCVPHKFLQNFFSHHLIRNSGEIRPVRGRCMLSNLTGTSKVGRHP